MSRTHLTLSLLSMLLLVPVTGCQPAGQQDSKLPFIEGADAAVRNGARIYFTGASERGTAITSSGGSNFGGGMMGGGLGPGGYGQLLTCASCHGPEARGGTHRMHMRTMTAPDIRFAALSAMPEMKGRKSPYGIDDFRQTVENGRHPDGDEVKADMPRWQMGQADLADLFAFLKAVAD